MAKSRSPKLLSKHSNPKEPKAIDTASTVPHCEPKHNDDDEITAARFPFGELIPNWQTFNVNTKNPAINSKFASCHHGSTGGKKLSDFKTFKLACCLEFIDRTIGCDTHRVRCMNVFTVDSNQCITHGKTAYKDGPNRIYTLMKHNKTGNWGMLKDTDDSRDTIPLADWQVAQQYREAAAAKFNEAFERGLETDRVLGGRRCHR